jgi:hypothetical protein
MSLLDPLRSLYSRKMYTGTCLPFIPLFYRTESIVNYTNRWTNVEDTTAYLKVGSWNWSGETE